MAQDKPDRTKQTAVVGVLPDSDSSSKRRRYVMRLDERVALVCGREWL
jgi:hypothetical protein